MAEASVTYSIAYKRSLPKYENVTPFFSLTMQVGEGQTLEEVKEEVVATVDGWLMDKMEEIDNDTKG